MGRLALACHRHAWPLLIAVFILSAGLTVYVARTLSVHTDTDEMIDPRLPFRQVYRAFNEDFPQIADSLVIVIRAPVPEAADDARDRLAKALRADPLHFKSVYTPGAGAFFARNGLLFLSEEELERLTDRLASAQPVLAAMAEEPSLARFFDLLREGVDKLREGDGNANKGTLDVAFEALLPVFTAFNEGTSRPLSWTAMFDPENAGDGAAERFIIAQPVLDAAGLHPAKAALDAARTAAGQALQGMAQHVEIDFTGKIALNAEELKSVSDGAALAGILSTLLVALILGLGLRSLKLVAATLLTLLIGLVWTAAFATMAIGYLNIISVAFAVLFIGLGIDFGVHFALRYSEERTSGKSAPDALFRTASGTGAALALCAPTTALAFFAFVPTAYVGLAQLGIISGTGIFISLIASLTLLPAFLRVLPGKTSRRAEPAHQGLARAIERHGRGITMTALVIGLAAAFIATNARFDADPIRLKDPTAPSVKAYYRLVEDRDASPYAVQALAGSAAEADALAAQLKAMPAVHRILRLASFVPTGQEEKLARIDTLALLLTPVLQGATAYEPQANPADAEALRRLADSIAEYAVNAGNDAPGERLAHALGHFLSKNPLTPALLGQLRAAIFAYWPKAMAGLADSMAAAPVTLEDVPQDIAERYVAANGSHRIEVFPAGAPRDERDLERFVDTIAAVAPVVTGSPVQIVGAGKVVRAAMLEATALAAFLVAGFLYLTLRDVRQVGLILLPIALAAALTIAASVLLPLPFNFANVIVLPLLIGLGVDSGIHLVARAHEGEGPDLLATSTPRAVLLSALTTLASFGTLAVSAHRGTASMGELLLIAIFFTLVCTLVVLPGMIAWVEQRARTKS